jgi:hypothetical protein
MVLRKLVFVFRGIKISGPRWDTLGVIDWEAHAKNRKGYTRGKVLPASARQGARGLHRESLGMDFAGMMSDMRVPTH